jgi:amino acid adenylation domain-containing protein
MWNDIAADYPKDACIHQMFEVQVERTPDAVAVAFEKQQLTYRQLNQRANQLAHHLRSLGVGPEVLVGICLERSIEMVVGLLGILKAGGAYVPLDPAYPIERLAFILEDTQAPVMLTQEQLVESLPAHGAQVVCLDSDWEVIAQNSQENPVGGATTDNLVYVIYTSGSTGQPKGVMISHRGICNQLCWRQTAFSLTETDRVLQTISFSFDPSVWQIFWPLSFGAQLIIARPGGHQDSAYLVKLIAQQQITVIALVPSMLRLFLEEKGIETCKCLRHVTCGGEDLPVELIERFFARLNLDNVLHNCYGPTEASIDATFWTCKRGTNQPIAPIGRPIANTRIYILDSDLQPVPVGEPGELHIGSIGLARGYLNRPELTAEKFIPNPFSDESGARLYKTGDLARYLPDGNIEFLGRIDHQVKIRGFRIELEEIEAALSQHPAVRQSVVMAREDVPGDKRLVAYVVASQEPVLANSELRRFLKEKLPDYMVPSAFVILEGLPLTPNGKIDRMALPALDTSKNRLEEDFAPCCTPTQEVLAGIWTKVLRLERVGIHDNFFEIGGNSLLATQVISRLREAFQVELSLRSLFELPTVADLSECVEMLLWARQNLQALGSVTVGDIEAIEL